MNGNINIDIYECENLKCEMCKSIFFENIIVIKIIPRILAGAKEDIKQSIGAIRCADCGWVPDAEVFEPRPKPKLTLE